MTPRLAALILLVGLASTPAPASAAAQPVQLRTADGVPIAAALYQADGDAPAVVLVHMYTRTKEDWLSLIHILLSAAQRESPAGP